MPEPPRARHDEIDFGFALVPVMNGIPQRGKVALQVRAHRIFRQTPRQVASAWTSCRVRRNITWIRALFHKTGFGLLARCFTALPDHACKPESRKAVCRAST
jgi:hypothetical protein